MKNKDLLAYGILLLLIFSVGSSIYDYRVHSRMVENMHPGINMGISDMMNGESMVDMSMDERRDVFIFLKNNMQRELLSQGGYKCCLEKPCTYCIEKTPGHGEGAICNCLEDIVNGKHPCGECIGEILEGHGNSYLKEYFALAIAEKVGMNYLEVIESIIEEKYKT
jgi:hypothetical protein